MAVLMEIKAQPVALGRIFCFGGESVGKLLPLCSACVPGAVQGQYKRELWSSLSHPLLLPSSAWHQGEFCHFSTLPSLPPSPPVFQCMPVTWSYAASWDFSL